MEIIEKTTRKIEVVELEVTALKSLIEKREKWLSDPINRKKRTYEAVNKDTASMLTKYKELVEEMNEIKSLLKPNKNGKN